MKEKIWKTLVQNGEEFNRYGVSNYGEIYDRLTEKMVAQVLTGKPQYYYVNIRKDDGKRLLRRVNNIVSWTFHGEPPTPKHTSDHIDRDKLNNVEWNLRWVDKRTQAVNKDYTVVMPCGTPVLHYLEKEGYNCSTGIGRYLYQKLLKDTSQDITNVLFSWANNLNPYPLPWKERSTDKGYEYRGVWYPDIKSVCQYNKTVVSVDKIRDLLRQGFSIEEAIKYDPEDRHRFNMDGFFMSRKEHCKRLCIGLERVEVYMVKHNISFEEACKLPVKRVTKYSINSEVKTVAGWWDYFDLNRTTCKNYLSRHKCFRKTLEYYGVCTKDMVIYPCDGDVVMKNKPI